MGDDARSKVNNETVPVDAGQAMEKDGNKGGGKVADAADDGVTKPDEGPHAESPQRDG